MDATRESGYDVGVSEKSRDQHIGENVAALRRDQSQKAVADAMRKRGHKWSQATVWAIEKGERSLKMAEAVDLAEVLAPHLPTGVVVGDSLAGGSHGTLTATSEVIMKNSLDRAQAALDELQGALNSMGVVMEFGDQRARTAFRGEHQED